MSEGASPTKSLGETVGGRYHVGEGVSPTKSLGETEGAPNPFECTHPLQNHFKGVLVLLRRLGNTGSSAPTRPRVPCGASWCTRLCS